MNRRTSDLRRRIRSMHPFIPDMRRRTPSLRARISDSLGRTSDLRRRNFHLIHCTATLQRRIDDLGRRINDLREQPAAPRWIDEESG